jgi:hypothetical protein
MDVMAVAAKRNKKKKPTATEMKCRRSTVSVSAMKKTRRSGEEHPKPPLASTGSVVESPVFVCVVALLFIVILIVGNMVDDRYSVSNFCEKFAI